MRVFSFFSWAGFVSIAEGAIYAKALPLGGTKLVSGFPLETSLIAERFFLSEQSRGQAWVHDALLLKDGWTSPDTDFLPFVCSPASFIRGDLVKSLSLSRLSPPARYALTIAAPARPPARRPLPCLYFKFFCIIGRRGPCEAPV